MKIFTAALLLPLISILSLSNLALAQNETNNTNESWNILSLDGGGIRGLITATVVKYMEEYAYNYSTQ